MTAPMPDGPSLSDLTFPHLSEQQLGLILALDHLSDGEKASILTMLDDWTSRDCYWPRTEEQLHDSLADVYGVVLGSDGLWRDAMVPDGKGGWVLDPSVVA